MTAQSEIGRTDFVTDVAACVGCRRRGDGVARKPASFCLLTIVDRECDKTNFTGITPFVSISGKCLELTGRYLAFLQQKLDVVRKTFHLTTTGATASLAHPRFKN